MNFTDLQALEAKLMYSFKQKDLLKTALTHKSCSLDPNSNNERLEFLGDAVLQLVVSDYLLALLPSEKEGVLAKIRAMLVSQPSLAKCARDLGVGPYMKLGRGEEQTGARDRDSLLSDTMEAVFGAIYQDSDLQSVKPIILKLLPPWQQEDLELIDAKTTLQEKLQAQYFAVPTYHTTASFGPDHQKWFTVEVRFRQQVLGNGQGPTKKEAAQEAAREALRRMKFEMPLQSHDDPDYRC